MFKISPFSGKRFKAFFEKMSFSSNTTSNTPPPDDIKEISILGKLFFSSASKLEALGK